MKNFEGTKQHSPKEIIVFLLYLGSLIILFLGIYFCAFSVLNNIQLKVLSTSIPGMVFGLLIAYLGTRYYFMVSNFKKGFYESNSKFSWSNFKKTRRGR